MPPPVKNRVKKLVQFEFLKLCKFETSDEREKKINNSDEDEDEDENEYGITWSTEENFGAQK